MIEQLLNSLVFSTLALPGPVVGLLAGRPTERDGQTLNPQVQLLLWLMGLSGRPMPHEVAVVEARGLLEGLDGMSGPRREMEKVEDWRIPGPAGGEIPVRIYIPRRAAEALPVLLYFHGGGWVIGSLASHDAVCRRLAADADCIVLSVDYRLAPEHRFPAAVEDAMEAWRWTVKAAASFGGDPARVAIGGDSAGGNLAAVASALIRDSELPNPVLQMLIYPVTDLSRESASYAKFASGFYLSRDTMRWFRAHYLSDGQHAADPRASPLLAPTLSGLPPAYLATAGFDVLRDEGRAYAERLAEEGSVVDYRNYPDLIHGYFNMSGIVESAGAAFADAVVALQRAFGRGA